ncbi:MAG: hypothetical protein A2V85_00465 [Chloroflexi bacterium RBG_16_72_14]|nr:MAG: hypothetical protein A2V85_00465 [Chloroflexi bacterium RBG_16_72_14]
MITLAAILVLAQAAPVLAKEGLEARFDAPIARDTPGGTELEVGMRVTVPDGDTVRPVEGSPIYLRLIGPDGSSTWQLGREGRVSGHYTMRILVPAGGVSRVEAGIHGTTDLPITIVGDALVAGGITKGTAQVAPAAAAALTPLPRASAPAPVTGEAPVVPAASPAAIGDAAPVPWLLVIGAALLAVLALGAGAVGVARRGRHGVGAGRRVADPHRAPGA